MNQFENKEVIQAILIADNNIESLRPLSDTNSTALLPLVNTALIDYALEALNYSGVEEVFIYASLHLPKVRDHIKHRIASLCSWSLGMNVHVIGGEGCRNFGDAMRDIDAKGLIRGHFILLGADTVMNADLRPILQQHKKTTKYDNGAVATLVFKEVATHFRTGSEVMVAVDKQNNRLHFHQRLKLLNTEPHFEIPLEVFLLNSQISLMHNLIDPQIAIGSPSMLALFSDNFDFETRDDFVRGILINEEILDSRIYVSLLSQQQYARKVNNWISYQIVSQDVINRWAYPLVPDMGIYCLTKQYMFLKNNIYKSPKARVAKVNIRENCVVQINSSMEACGKSEVICSVIGRNCKIGKNCQISNAYVMDNVTIGDDCLLDYCVIGAGSAIGNKCTLIDGTVLGEKCFLPAGTTLVKKLVKSSHSVGEDQDKEIEKIGSGAFIIEDKPLRRRPTISGEQSDSDDDDDEAELNSTEDVIPRMSKISPTYAESDVSSDDDDSQVDMTPTPDDTNIFLSEVMDSLARGYQEKSNPDFLVLEINSSRYAYNMSLKEVNFFVVKGLFSLDCIKTPKDANVLAAVHNLLKQLGPVLSNYIKTEDSMIDCLKALEDVCNENFLLLEKFSQVVHYLYDRDFVSEDAILSWHDQIDAGSKVKKSIEKLITWLNQCSDEEEDHDDEETE